MSGQGIDISKLSLEELKELYQQISSELENSSTSMLALQQTAGKFAAAGQSLEGLKERQHGQPVLIPMTESLYVPGNLESVDTILLEIGTGYFIEKDVDGGIDYCRRKVMLVKDNMEQLSQIIKSRQVALSQIEQVAEERQTSAGAGTGVAAS